LASNEALFSLKSFDICLFSICCCSNISVVSFNIVPNFIFDLSHSLYLFKYSSFWLACSFYINDRSSYYIILSSYFESSIFIVFNSLVILWFFSCFSVNSFRSNSFSLCILFIFSLFLSLLALKFSTLLH
jgi:hypothetical protein